VKFAPRPENDFRSFIRTYFERCKKAFPRITAIAGKWAFDDLIPGMSDFDTRFIVNGPMSADDWNAMALAVSEVHTQLARDVPDWARNLEHLPGLNFTLDEMVDPVFYYPEFKLWTFYDGDRDAIDAIESALGARPWGERDELYHLKRIATFIGPYQRGIDPPINLGRFESKYPLHSRFMHYFAPPVQSAVALAKKHHVRGKLDALRVARTLFPHPETIDRVLGAVEQHYELPNDYEEPQLTNLERELERYLDDMWQSLRSSVTVVKVEPDDNVSRIRAKLREVASDPIPDFFEGVKFSRLMKGRLLFYAERIPWFDASRLIEIELGRMVSNFIEKPLTAYARVCFGESMTSDEVLARLRGKVLSADEVEALHRFVHIAGSRAHTTDDKAHARQIAMLYSPVLVILEKLSADLLQQRQSHN
jgi:hypothetical protein